LSEQKTIFSRIIDNEIPTEKIYEDDLAIVIEDIQPQAPTHLLVIPKEPIPRLVDATKEQAMLLGHLLLVVGEVTRKLGLDDAFRLVINNGEGAGQTVFHLHLHILAQTTFAESSTGKPFN
jgi:histidine triad (HIT) family protein